MKLKVIIPNSGMDSETLKSREEMLSECAAPGTKISVDCIDKGPESIESAYDEVLASVYLLKKVIEAEENGFDAVIIYCGDDPAIGAARELVDIPVVGPGKLSKLIAVDLAYKFSVITVLKCCIPGDTEEVYRKGIDMNRLASVRSIDISVSDVREDLCETYKALLDVGRQCVETDGAQCIVLSCLGMAGLAAQLTKELGVPVIDPAFAAVKYAELLVSIGISHSKISHPRPMDKIRIE
ncbi:MAG: hydrogenase expression protein HupH [Ruminococcaceae bacterium]|nr:hydrogenase expression protein HupH [Oscillospiraceae bacterium]